MTYIPATQNTCTTSFKSRKYTLTAAKTYTTPTIASAWNTNSVGSNA